MHHIHVSVSKRNSSSNDDDANCDYIPTTNRQHRLKQPVLIPRAPDNDALLGPLGSHTNAKSTPLCQYEIHEDNKPGASIFDTLSYKVV